MKQKIGFIGCYSHDVILMLARALGCMGKRVLLRDCNDLHTLSVSVPIPEGLSAAKTVLEYDGFLFTEQDVDTELKVEYETELIDFGMDGSPERMAYCSEVIMTTDMLPHHIRRLQKLRIPNEKVVACIIRDATEIMCKGEQEVRDFMNLFPRRKDFFLAPDYRDVRNRYVCETLHEYNINKASPEMREMICGIVELLCPEYTDKEIRRNIKRRERRRYR